MKQLRFAFTGPSGSGKTTLAKFLEKETGVEFIPNSAGLIFSEEDKALLKEKYGYEGTGHKNVINLSNINPDFGWDFQMAILKARLSIIYSKTSFILDRSPIDNIVYMLLQTGHNQPENKIGEFIQLAKKATLCLTHVAHINPLEHVEDNNSRVPNLYYQQMVNSVFEHVISKYGIYMNVKVLKVNYTDLTLRKEKLLEFLSE